MSDDQFTKIFKYMQQEFAKVNEKLAEHDDKFAEHGGKFDKLNEKLMRHDGKFDKLEGAFAELFKRTDDRFRAIEEKLERVPDRDRIYGALDAILKNQETDQQERLIANHQLDRHEEWISRAADALSVSYDPAS